MAEVIAGPALAVPGLAGDAGQRVCKRPGCGNLVPVAGRGRTRLFCGDVCSRRFHNAARPAAGGVAVSPEQAGDPLGALGALIAQAGALLEMAREQAAALDPETVAVQLAEAEAARCRAEARAVTAEARAAEAEQEMRAALEEASAAHRGREAAESRARHGCEAAGQARRELAEAVARARADAEAARVRAGEQAAEAAEVAEMARAERDQASTQAAALVQAADADLARARQAEADARDQVRQARDDAAREREALDGQYRARLQAMEQLAAAERDRAVRAGQLADSEREHCHRLLAALTAAGGHEDPACPGGSSLAAGPASACSYCRGRGVAMSAGDSIPGPGGTVSRGTAAAAARERGNFPPCGTRARRFASSLITVMIRKEGTYVRALRVAPACQLMLDVPGAEGDAGRDPGRVWAQMPDTARARVLCLLAAMIAAGVLADGGGAVRADG